KNGTIIFRMNPFFHFLQPYFLMKNNNVRHITQKMLPKQTYFKIKNKRRKESVKSSFTQSE
ncbi:hypothetical protein, partial [Aggregatibacter sp.]